MASIFVDGRDVQPFEFWANTVNETLKQTTTASFL